MFDKYFLFDWCDLKGIRVDPKEMIQEQVTDLTSEVHCFQCLFSSGEVLVGLKGEQAACKFSKSSSDFRKLDWSWLGTRAAEHYSLVGWRVL